MQSEQLILTFVLQVKPELHVSWDALLEPRTPSKVVHTPTNMDVVKAAGVTRRKHDLARSYGMLLPSGESQITTLAIGRQVFGKHPAVPSR